MIEKLELGGAWELYQGGKGSPCPAQVPGCVHTDLMATGKLEDPFVRDRELSVQWIGETDWVYRRSFEVTPSLLRRDRVALRCEGLDTLATVLLNGKVLGKADNMFRTWTWDVKRGLKAGKNTLEVRFASAANFVREKQKKRALPGWGGPLEIRGRAWLRKQPCNFGWDWGPVLVTAGIWRAIRLEAWDEARLADIQLLQKHPKGRADLECRVSIESARKTELAVRILVKRGGREVASAHGPVRNGAAALKCSVTAPELWWPKGLGGQPLYDVEVELLSGGKSIDRGARRIGLRELRLDRHKDQWGESFQFYANGAPFFAKGGNWIPTDAFVTRTTVEQYRALLTSVADANMNMLRVWGGGIYENDLFYELCDELGICVWQEFMFACSTYPTFDKAFLKNVEAEAVDNVRRIRHHACLALWCGNNELEQGLVGDKWTERTMSWADYGKLFDKLLPSVVAKHDPGRDYWPGSPHTPVGKRSDFNNPDSGDAHLWTVWHGKQPFEWYRTCKHRFNSEFGFQSFPEPRIVAGYTGPEDRNITARVMEHHQRSGIGNATIMTYMLDWFRLPGRFEDQLWASQILQGMAMKYAVEHWRRQMPRGMGTLYWQINDNWPVASWSSIDYFGNWKGLHYMAKRFNAPVLLSLVEDAKQSTIEVHLTNDLRQQVAGEVSWRFTDLDGKDLASGRFAAKVGPLRNAMVKKLALAKVLGGRPAREAVFYAEYLVGGKLVSDNLATFARPKQLELRDPGLKYMVVEKADGLAVEVSAERPALWVWMQLDELGARYSDRFFHLMPGKTVCVTVKPEKNMTKDELERALTVRSLVDTYQS